MALTQEEREEANAKGVKYGQNTNEITDFVDMFAGMVVDAARVCSGAALFDELTGEEDKREYQEIFDKGVKFGRDNPAAEKEDKVEETKTDNSRVDDEPTRNYDDSPSDRSSSDSDWSSSDSSSSISYTPTRQTPQAPKVPPKSLMQIAREKADKMSDYELERIADDCQQYHKSDPELWRVASWRKHMNEKKDFLELYRLSMDFGTEGDDDIENMRHESKRRIQKLISKKPELKKVYNYLESMSFNQRTQVLFHLALPLEKLIAKAEANIEVNNRLKEIASMTDKNQLLDIRFNGNFPYNSAAEDRYYELEKQGFFRPQTGCLFGFLFALSSFIR